MWVKIKRNVYVGSEVKSAGSELDLDRDVANLLIGAGKAEAIPEPAPAPVVAKPAKPKPAPVTEPAASEEKTDGT